MVVAFERAAVAEPLPRRAALPESGRPLVEGGWVVVPAAGVVGAVVGLPREAVAPPLPVTLPVIERDVGAAAVLPGGRRRSAVGVVAVGAAAVGVAGGGLAAGAVRDTEPVALPAVDNVPCDAPPPSAPSALPSSQLRRPGSIGAAVHGAGRGARAAHRVAGLVLRVARRLHARARHRLAARRAACRGGLGIGGGIAGGRLVASTTPPASVFAVPATLPAASFTVPAGGQVAGERAVAGQAAGGAAGDAAAAAAAQAAEAAAQAAHAAGCAPPPRRPAWADGESATQTVDRAITATVWSVEFLRIMLFPFD